MKNPFRKKKNEPDIVVVEQMLANVFSACQKEPNTVPLEVIMSYSNYRRERFILQRTLIAAMLVLFLLLPSLFVTAKIIISRHEDGDSLNPVYEVQVPSRVPISGLDASIGEYNVPVTEIDSHNYILTPTVNGEMCVSVTLINKQITTVQVPVTEVDMNAPTLVSTGFDDHFFYIYVEDDKSGIDPLAISMVDSEGNQLDGYEFDAETNCVKVPYPETVTNVLISDFNGNVLKLQLKPQ